MLEWYYHLERGHKMRNHTEYGETFTDERGIRWHQVFEYENGVCVDRYVTRVGVQL